MSRSRVPPQHRLPPLPKKVSTEVKSAKNSLSKPPPPSTAAAKYVIYILFFIKKLIINKFKYNHILLCPIEHRNNNFITDQNNICYIKYKFKKFKIADVFYYY